jgi:hypothetical protein
MTTSVRFTTFENTTGDPVVSGGALANQGQDYALECIRVKFSADDIGAGAGQTQHEDGMLFTEFQGAAVKGLVSVTVLATDTISDMVKLGNDEHSMEIGFDIVNSSEGSKVYIFDRSEQDDTSRIQVGDRVVALFAIGNS